jgi:hypothetical protein
LTKRNIKSRRSFCLPSPPGRGAGGEGRRTSGEVEQANSEPRWLGHDPHPSPLPEGEGARTADPAGGYGSFNGIGACPADHAWPAGQAALRKKRKRSTDGAPPDGDPGGMLSVLREHETASKRLACSRSTESMPPRIMKPAQIRAPTGERQGFFSQKLREGVSA